MDDNLFIDCAVDVFNKQVYIPVRSSFRLLLKDVPWFEKWIRKFYNLEIPMT